MKNPPANAEIARDTRSILGSGRSPRVGNGNPFHYPCLENSMDRRAWWATVHMTEHTHTHTHTLMFPEPKPKGGSTSNNFIIKNRFYDSVKHRSRTTIYIIRTHFRENSISVYVDIN